MSPFKSSPGTLEVSVAQGVSDIGSEVEHHNQSAEEHFADFLSQKEKNESLKRELGALVKDLFIDYMQYSEKKYPQSLIEAEKEYSYQKPTFRTMRPDKQVLETSPFGEWSLLHYLYHAVLPLRRGPNPNILYRQGDDISDLEEGLSNIDSNIKTSSDLKNVTQDVVSDLVSLNNYYSEILRNAPAKRDKILEAWLEVDLSRAASLFSSRKLFDFGLLDHQINENPEDKPKKEMQRAKLEGLIKNKFPHMQDSEVKALVSGKSWPTNDAQLTIDVVNWFATISKDSLV